MSSSLPRNSNSNLQVFDSGRVELSRSTSTSDTGEEARAGVNTFKLNVQTNAVCVDILVWAAKEETGEAGVIDILENCCVLSLCFQPLKMKQLLIIRGTI